MYSGKQQTAVNAASIVMFALMFYWVDVVILLDRIGLLTYFGWHGKSVIYIGGMCVAVLMICFLLPRAKRVLSAAPFDLSQDRFSRYVFFARRRSFSLL
jgi:hypothetical protein